MVGITFGRYESGVDIQRTIDDREDMSAPARVKSSMPVYNYITYENAKAVAERTYIGKSKLCNSYAWDTALKFIDGLEGTYSVNSQGENCTGKIVETGYHQEKNIYDMGGNLFEYVTEISSEPNTKCMVRGGVFIGSYLQYPAAYRSLSDGGGYGGDVGFRIILYL